MSQTKELYSWIYQHYPRFRNGPRFWKNSIRHTLSKCVRVCVCVRVRCRRVLLLLLLLFLLRSLSSVPLGSFVRTC